MKRIESVTVRRMLDDSPDLSWIGEYQGTPGQPDRTIDREERGDMGRNEYRYFVAMNSPAETGNPESLEQDYQRMEDYERGGWQCIGIRAEAKVAVSLDGGKSWKVDTLTSGGLWGIESDSEDTYLSEEGENQKAELRDCLKEYGFSEKAIAKAFKNVETVDA